MVNKGKNSAALAPELDALDRGRYVAAAARFEEGDVPRGDAAALWCADVAIYLGRLEKVEHYLSLAPDSELKTVLEAERLFATNAWDAADELLEGLTSSRALINRGRVAFKKGEWDRLLEIARDVERQASDEGNEFLVGRARYLGAVALDETGHRKMAEDLMRSAIIALRETERGLCLAWALNHMGWLIVERVPDEARSLVLEARAIAQELGQSGALVTFDTALVQHVHRAGRYAECVERSMNLVALAVDLKDAENECHARTMRCVSALALGRVDEAKKALEGFEISALPDSDSTRMKAELLMHRVAAHGYDASAPGRIDQMIARDARFCSSWQRTVAKLWLWDSLLVVDPWQARARRVELRADAQGDSHWFIQAELRAVDRTPRVTRWTGAGWIFVAEAIPDGVKVQDPLNVHDDVARHEVFEKAHREAGGVQGKVVELTGWSGSHVSKMRASYDYPPTSPGRPRLPKEARKPRRNAVKRRNDDGL